MTIFDDTPKPAPKGRLVRPAEDRHKTLNKRAAPGQGESYDYFREYRLANAEKLAKQKAEWARQNRELIRVYRRDWSRRRRAGMPDKFARGMTNSFAKLTDAKVIEMRARYAAGGISQRALAAEYGVAESRVWRIVNGTAWTHLLPKRVYDPDA
jgi:hypothetical protein